MASFKRLYDDADARMLPVDGLYLGGFRPETLSTSGLRPDEAPGRCSTVSGHEASAWTSVRTRIRRRDALHIRVSSHEKHAPSKLHLFHPRPRHG
jgi:hypothetical protein